MRTFIVTFSRYPCPDGEEIEEAYVLAKDFQEAQRKVEKRCERDRYSGAHVRKIEVVGGEIIV